MKDERYLNGYNLTFKNAKYSLSEFIMLGRKRPFAFSTENDCREYIKRLMSEYRLFIKMKGDKVYRGVFRSFGQTFNAIYSQSPYLAIAFRNHKGNNSEFWNEFSDLQKASLKGEASTGVAKIKKKTKIL
ncbi:hypothetical protein [Stagnimonas aquatica]|uniref:hypothetical protein n=1 Tax=Stagnimonas aquatica TaxID=2689987 RepID=UPI0011CD56DA|nr:hypothetical protein [Stagnimonas aquatica]